MLSTTAAAALAVPPPFDVVQASLCNTITGEPLGWMPAVTVPPAVHILGLSLSLRPRASIVLASVLRATQLQAAFLPGPLVAPPALRADHGDDGVTVFDVQSSLATA